MLKVIDKIIGKISHIEHRSVIIYMDRKGNYKKRKVSYLTTVVLVVREKKAERDYYKQIERYY